MLRIIFPILLAGILLPNSLNTRVIEIKILSNHTIGDVLGKQSRKEAEKNNFPLFDIFI
tara:strand:- start:841 stop:1017 length:177 start_codon:yes stop_codon:yes gene_type:complete